jgi:spore coat polysaccharide biosynthesis protein SpsF (cytidylyltransferase family)
MPWYDRDEFDDRYYGKGEFNKCTDDRFSTYFGSADDLLDRYFNAARNNNIDLIVRVTGDCPLIQGWLIDEMLIEYLKNGSNSFMGNNDLVSVAPYPNGTDVEIFPYWMLADAHLTTQSSFDREHVTPFMYSKAMKYKVEQFLNKRPNTMITTKHPDVSFDTVLDYNLIRKIAKIYDECGDLNKALNEVE